MAGLVKSEVAALRRLSRNTQSNYRGVLTPWTMLSLVRKGLATKRKADEYEQTRKIKLVFEISELGRRTIIEIENCPS